MAYITKVKVEITHFCNALFHRAKFAQKDFAFVKSEKLKGEKNIYQRLFILLAQDVNVSCYIGFSRKKFPLMKKNF